MEIQLAGELQEKFKQGYTLAGENEDGELEWFSPTRKSAGEVLSECIPNAFNRRAEEVKPEDWAKWYAHKSNKEMAIEGQEREEELREEELREEEIENEIDDIIYNKQ